MAAQYRPLSLAETDSHQRTYDAAPPKCGHGIVPRLLVLSTACVISGLLGYLLGSSTIRSNAAFDRLPDGTRSEYVMKPFIRNETFVFPPSAERKTEIAWDELIPHGQGFVSVDIHAHGSGEVDLENDDPPLISAYHQLHCLYTLRRSYFSLSGHAPLAPADEAKHKPVHVAHCFDYLRQAIMCAADPVLEASPSPSSSSSASSGASSASASSSSGSGSPSAAEKVTSEITPRTSITRKQKPRSNAVNGWGAVHRCRDYAALYAFAETWADTSRKERSGFRAGVYSDAEFERYPFG